MGVFFINWITQLEGPTKNLLLRIFIFTIYLLAGAAVFRLIEAEYGREVKVEFDQLKIELKTLYNINDTILNRFIQQVRRAETEGYWDANFDRWSFFGSLFFTTTVLTTIGFGHMAPRTFAGRLFCMIYAFFGIPITGLMLKSLGEKIMESSDIIFHLIDEKCYHVKEQRSTALRTSLLLFTVMLFMLLLLAAAAHEYEGWTFFQGLYFGFVTLSTIGFGDFVPTTPHSYSHSHIHVALFILVTFVYVTVGLAVVSSVLVSVSRMFENKTRWDFVPLENESDDDVVESEIIIDK